VTVHETAERGFQRAAGAYERGRPGYEPELVDWLIDRAALEPGRWSSGCAPSLWPRRSR